MILPEKKKTFPVDDLLDSACETFVCKANYLGKLSDKFIFFCPFSDPAQIRELYSEFWRQYLALHKAEVI